MLELGRVDFEVTLTLCRLQWGSCAPCYVPARSNSDGGSCSPRLFSTPLFQHQSSQDSTSLSKTPLSFILSSQDRCLLSLPLDAKFTPWCYYKKKKGKSTEVTLFHLDFLLVFFFWENVERISGFNCECNCFSALVFQRHWVLLIMFIFARDQRGKCTSVSFWHRARTHGF